MLSACLFSFANSSCCPTRFANLSVASKYSFVALARFSKRFIAIEQFTRDKLRCDYCSNFGALADNCPSALMNILLPVVWLKIKYSPGRATDNSTTRAFGASRSGGYTWPLQISVLTRSKRAIIREIPYFPFSRTRCFKAVRVPGFVLPEAGM